VLKRAACYIVNTYILPDPAIPQNYCKSQEKKYKQSGLIIYKKIIFRRIIYIKPKLKYFF
jgi:hypothetical protein